MAARARALMESGARPDEVLHACYGVWFPEELFAFAELYAEDKEPNTRLVNRPFNLIVPLDRGGPPAAVDIFDELERRVYQLDPTLVPLMHVYGDFYEHGGTMVSYRLSDLAEGRSTIWGLQGDLLDDAAVATRLGDSLGEVLRADAADRLQHLEAEWASPYNYGAGSLDKCELDEGRENLAACEELIRRTAERRRPRLVRP
ncbi:MAG: hypothetical protein JNL83_25705 [Myxococcales bacterium]|nr:hypothetical protein [Myxococcales bacterium]